MACRHFQRLLPLYADDALSEKERLQLENHLLHCPACTKEVEAFCQLVGRLRRVSKAHPRAEFCTCVMQRLDPAPVPPTPKRAIIWIPVFAGSACAAAFLLLLLISTPSHLHKNDFSAFAPKSILRPATGDRLDKLIRAVGPVALNLKAPMWSHYLARTSQRSQDAPFAPNDMVLPAYSVYRSALAQPAFMSVPSEVPEWSGEHCAMKAAQSVTARNAAELETLWAQARITPVLHRLDPGRQMLAGIFLGQQPGTGYEIHLAAVEPRADQIVVKYSLRHASEPGAETASQPYLLVLLPFSKLPVVFQEE